MRLQEYIEEALQDIMQARAYVIANSVPVARKTEREATNKGDLFVDIVADGEERLSNNHDLYFMEVGVSAVAKIQEDLTGVSLDALWADVSDAITQDLTAAALNAAITTIDASSGITIAGFDYQPADTPQTLDQYEQKEQRLRIAFSFS